MGCAELRLWAPCIRGAETEGAWRGTSRRLAFGARQGPSVPAQEMRPLDWLFGGIYGLEERSPLCSYTGSLRMRDQRFVGA